VSQKKLQNFLRAPEEQGVAMRLAERSVATHRQLGHETRTQIFPARYSGVLTCFAARFTVVGDISKYATKHGGFAET